MNYRVIRSDRKSLALQVTEEGLLVRAPRQVTQAQIQHFVEAHRDWIARQLQKQSTRPPVQQLTMEELHALADRALEIIPQRVAHYAPLLGVSYGRITIRNQKSRWGSCTAAGNLNFNCLLMLAPPEVVDAVVVHELCHRLEMNHSPAFYAHVLRIYPDYHKWNAWLKEHGSALLRRMTG